MGPRPKCSREKQKRTSSRVLSRKTRSEKEITPLTFLRPENRPYTHQHTHVHTHMHNS